MEWWLVQAQVWRERLEGLDFGTYGLEEDSLGIQASRVWQRATRVARLRFGVEGLRIVGGRRLFFFVYLILGAIFPL